MTEPYSLAVEPWLPVATVEGERKFVRIRDIGHPDLLRVDTGRADCDISVTEFLIGLLAISMGPTDNYDWPRRFETPPSPDEIAAAIKPFAHALVLDGDGPRFFQDFEDLELRNDAAREPIASLFLETPAGHFVKEGTVSALSRRGTALALIALQTGAPAGGRGHRTSLRGGGPSTTLVIPRIESKAPTLWQLLWANVPEGLKIAPEDAAKVIPWLAPTRTSHNDEITTPAHTHFAQAFFGMPRRIRLTFTPGNGERCAVTGDTDDVIVMSYVTRPYGAYYPSHTWRHPLSPYYKSKDKEVGDVWLPLHFKAAGVSYRDWIGLTLKSKPADETSRPADIVAAFLKRAADIDLDVTQPNSVGLLAAGYAMDKMKPLDFTEAMLPLISTGNEDRDYHLAGCATAMVQAAEAASQLLLAALKTALYTDKKKAQPESSKAPLAAARARFWADTENPFYDTLRDLAAEAPDDADAKVYVEAKEAWREDIRNAALAIFDDLAPIDAPDSPDLKNIVNARSLLFYGLEGALIRKALGLAPPEKAEKKNKANGTRRKAA
ncbi:CRISPR-associated protein Cse1 [Rhodomicrobium udaipurense JA643]|uniref:Type I-E CRISPR-associated protein Cse1/CasA n=1 Tax=Rhodomicrobium udaipurense TaxID=1202716 RepID=A0A8I1GG06_9HYPH|nr:type I-E CRISPR-associated protein Cse1/CasA [Rhodomicrobium udaipurense]KAI95306.1 CRISPR-associated protein Cse1 [Rhodomicrobium udaipurense JA643]MBJ7544429.1 type I-E CRISPR-associated protein Cse1/CasA [Rhodomicrobium udaipurense]